MNHRFFRYFLKNDKLMKSSIGPSIFLTSCLVFSDTFKLCISKECKKCKKNEIQV